MEGGGKKSNADSLHVDGPVRLNVGGKVFETSLGTLQLSGEDSFLSSFNARSSTSEIFIDRDPQIFSALLSLLRTGRLSSTSRLFSKQELADEAIYYGIDALIRTYISPPPFSGIDATLVSSVCPAADGIASALSALEDGSIWIAHGGQVSSFDWTLSHSSTTRTHFDEISSICNILPDVAAIASLSGAGVHFYNLFRSRHVGSIHWSDPTDPRIYKACVPSITHSPTQIFAAFDCQHRENAVLCIDKGTLKVVSEVTRQSGNSSKFVAPSKMSWVPEMSAVVGSSITRGAFGYSGYVRMWDARSGCVVWDTNEPGTGRSSRFGDAFADVAVDTVNSLIFKVCSKSGDLAMADMRKLGDDPWIYMKDKNPGMNVKVEDANMLIHCHNGEVFVGRDGELEVWSKLYADHRDTVGESLRRRNFVGREEHSKNGAIRQIVGGGNRLFLSRMNVEGIEIWETTNYSGFFSFASQTF